MDNIFSALDYVKQNAQVLDIETGFEHNGSEQHVYGVATYDASNDKFKNLLYEIPIDTIDSNGRTRKLDYAKTSLDYMSGAGYDVSNNFSHKQNLKNRASLSQDAFDVFSKVIGNDGGVLVGHNVKFDIKNLSKHLTSQQRKNVATRLGMIGYDDRGYIQFNPNRLDTKKARNSLSELKNYVSSNAKHKRTSIIDTQHMASIAFGVAEQEHGISFNRNYSTGTKVDLLTKAFDYDENAIKNAINSSNRGVQYASHSGSDVLKQHHVIFSELHNILGELDNGQLSSATSTKLKRASIIAGEWGKQQKIINVANTAFKMAKYGKADLEKGGKTVTIKDSRNAIDELIDIPYYRKNYAQSQKDIDELRNTYSKWYDTFSNDLPNAELKLNELKDLNEGSQFWNRVNPQLDNLQLEKKTETIKKLPNGKFKKYALAGMATLGVTYVASGLFGSKISGKDDDANTIEGLPHSSQQTVGLRHMLTDFGSGWIGKLSDKITGSMINRSVKRMDDIMPGYLARIEKDFDPFSSGMVPTEKEIKFLQHSLHQQPHQFIESVGSRSLERLGPFSRSSKIKTAIDNKVRTYTTEAENLMKDSAMRIIGPQFQAYSSEITAYGKTYKPMEMVKELNQKGVKVALPPVNVFSNLSKDRYKAARRDMRSGKGISEFMGDEYGPKIDLLRERGYPVRNALDDIRGLPWNGDVVPSQQMQDRVRSNLSYRSELFSKALFEQGYAYQHASPKTGEELANATGRLIPGKNNAYHLWGKSGVYATGLTKGDIGNPYVTYYGKNILLIKDSKHFKPMNRGKKIHATVNEDLVIDAYEEYKPSRSEAFYKYLDKFSLYKNNPELKHSAPIPKTNIKISLVTKSHYEKKTPSYAIPTLVVEGEEKGYYSLAFGRAEKRGMYKYNKKATKKKLISLSNELQEKYGVKTFIKGGTASKALEDELIKSGDRLHGKSGRDKYKDLDLVVTGKVLAKDVYNMMKKHDIFVDMAVHPSLQDSLAHQDFGLNQAYIEIPKAMGEKANLHYTQAAAEDLANNRITVFEKNLSPARRNMRINKMQGYYPGATIPSQDDAYQVIDGLHENGIAPDLRHMLTDFGSGWIGFSNTLGVIGKSLGKASLNAGKELLKESKANLGLFSGSAAVGLFSGYKEGKEEREISVGAFAGNVALDMVDDMLIFGVPSVIAGLKGTGRGISPGVAKVLNRAESIGKWMESKPIIKKAGVSFFGYTVGKLGGELLGSLTSDSHGRSENNIQGLRHGGAAESTRRDLTEFGSGYRGPNPQLVEDYNNKEEVPYYQQYRASKIGLSESDMDKDMTQPKEKLGEYVNASATAGTALHKYMQTQMLKTGQAKDYEKLVYNPEYKISGHADIITDQSVGDIKTVSPGIFKSMSKQGKAKPMHEEQVQFYLGQTNKKRGFITYVNRQNINQQRTYNIDFNEQKYQRQLEKVARVRARVQRDIQMGKIDESKMPKTASMDTLTADNMAKLSKKKMISKSQEYNQDFKEEMQYLNSIKRPMPSSGQGAERVRAAEAKRRQRRKQLHESTQGIGLQLWNNRLQHHQM